MSNSNDSTDADAPSHERHDDRRTASIPLDGQTVLFDVENADAWLQSDTTVDLADVA